MFTSFCAVASSTFINREVTLENGTGLMVPWKNLVLW